MTLFIADPVHSGHRAEGHIERPERVDAILDRLREKGLMARLVPVPARDASEDELALVHDRRYIQIVRQVSERGGGRLDADTYLNERSWAAAVRAAGGVLAAAEAVLAGRDRTAFCAVRPPGHHALPGQGMGFCLFNNVAIAARFTRKRALIVDWDVHHGNGTQAAFWEDPSVWYLSFHRSPFYPGTGDEDERGAGNIINLPTSFGTPRERILERFSSALEKAGREFRPEIVFVSCGFDAHVDDPLGGLGLEAEDFRTMTDRVRALGVPVISALEGGYGLEENGLCAEQHVLGLLA
jgi:acetoin utilization deacetylase AcuC-like enzyme